MMGWGGLGVFCAFITLLFRVFLSPLDTTMYSSVVVALPFQCDQTSILAMPDCQVITIE